MSFWQSRKKWATEKFDNSKVVVLIKQNKFLTLGFLLAFFLFIYFFNEIKAIVVMILLILLGIFSMYWNKYIKVSIGIELIVFGTVLAGYLYGAWQAAIVGLTSLFIAELITERIQHSTIISFVGLAIISFLAPLFSGSDITFAGIVLTLVYNAIIAPGYIIMGSPAWTTFVFAVTDILFNAWVFFILAPKIVGIIV